MVKIIIFLFALITAGVGIHEMIKSEEKTFDTWRDTFCHAFSIALVLTVSGIFFTILWIS